MNRRSLVSLLIAGGALCTPLVGCNQVASVVARPSTPVPGTTPLKDLQSLGQLETRFAQGAGNVRLVLLVSPT